MKNYSLQQAIELNELSPCALRSCTKHRMQLSRFCHGHRDKDVKYGSPTGRRHHPREYEAEAQAVKLLIAKNRDHPGIKIGLRFFDRYLEDAVMRHPVPGQRHLLRQYDEGTRAEDLFIEAAAAFLYGWNSSSVDYSRELTYLVGLAVLARHNIRDAREPDIKHRPTISTSKIGMRERREAGQYVRDHLERLFQNIRTTFQRQEEEREERLKILGAPLSVE